MGRVEKRVKIGIGDLDFIVSFTVSKVLLLLMVRFFCPCE